MKVGKLRSVLILLLIIILLLIRKGLYLVEATLLSLCLYSLG